MLYANVVWNTSSSSPSFPHPSGVCDQIRSSRSCVMCHTLVYNNILLYAFKMRQDYLGTSYLDQKYLPGEQSKRREIWIDPSHVCWDNCCLILKAYDEIFLTPFLILQMKYLQNIRMWEIFPHLFITALPHLCSDTRQLINKWAELKIQGMLMSSAPVCGAYSSKWSVEFWVDDITRHAYVRFCCQSGGVRCILEGLSPHMILNQ